MDFHSYEWEELVVETPARQTRVLLKNDKAESYVISRFDRAQERLHLQALDRLAHQELILGAVTSSLGGQAGRAGRIAG